MLRQDVIAMLGCKWEPKVPNETILKKQVVSRDAHSKTNGKMAGSVRMALGKMKTEKK